MIPKIVHQIFFNLRDEKIEDIPLFQKSIESIKKHNPNVKHILWDEEMCLNLMIKDFPEYLYFYVNMRYDIQRIDYIRNVILHSFGGIYVDLDMICLKNIDDLFKKRFFIHSLRHLKPNHSEFVLNDLMGSEKGFKFWKILLDRTVDNYKEKESIEVYNTWKARFVLQTTGPKFLSRILKDVLPSYKPEHLVYIDTENAMQKEWRFETKIKSKDGYYFEDYKAGTWLPNLKKDDKKS